MITLTGGMVETLNGSPVNGSITFQLNCDATVLAVPGGFVAGNIPITFQLDGNVNILPKWWAISNLIWREQSSSSRITRFDFQREEKNVKSTN